MSWRARSHGLHMTGSAAVAIGGYLQCGKQVEIQGNTCSGSFLHLKSSSNHSFSNWIRYAFHSWWWLCYGATNSRQWAGAEREALCEAVLSPFQSHTIFECALSSNGIPIPIRWWSHFDDRAVDAVFEQTLSLVIWSSFGCPSPHSEGANIYYISLQIDIEWNSIGHIKLNHFDYCIPTTFAHCKVTEIMAFCSWNWSRRC